MIPRNEPGLPRGTELFQGTGVLAVFSYVPVGDVTGEGDEVGIFFQGFLDDAADVALTDGEPDVKIRDVRDPEAFKLSGKIRHGDGHGENRGTFPGDEVPEAKGDHREPQDEFAFVRNGEKETHKVRTQEVETQKTNEGHGKVAQVVDHVGSAGILFFSLSPVENRQEPDEQERQGEENPTRNSHPEGPGRVGEAQSGDQSQDEKKSFHAPKLNKKIQIPLCRWYPFFMARLWTSLLLFLVSCSSIEVPTTTLAPRSTPYLRRYKHKKKELLYVAVGLRKNMSPRTKELVQDAVKRFEPEILITMIPVDDGRNVDQEYTRCEVDQECTLVAWSCNYAKPRGILCVSGEPYHSDLVRAAAKDHGVTQEEILFFYVYRELLNESLEEARPLDGLDEIIEEQIERLNIVSRFDKPDFLRRYRDKLGKGPVKLYQDYLLPDPRGNYLQRLSEIIHATEASFVLGRIRKEQMVHQRVLVIYMENIFKRQHPKLEKFFSTELP